MMWNRKKLIAGLSTPPEQATSTVMAIQSRPTWARTRYSNAAVASGRERWSQPSTDQSTRL